MLRAAKDCGTLHVMSSLTETVLITSQSDHTLLHVLYVLLIFRDLPKMAEKAGTEAVFLDATAETTVPGGPMGGQTRVSLRDEHLSYLLTWLSIQVNTIVTFETPQVADCYTIIVFCPCMYMSGMIK
jgi:hypothetical protein